MILYFFFFFFFFFFLKLRAPVQGFQLGAVDDPCVCRRLEAEVPLESFVLIFTLVKMKWLLACLLTTIDSPTE